MNDAKIFQLVRRVFGFISNNPFCFCVILGAAYFLYWLVSNGLLYGADTSNKVAGIFTPLIVGGVTAYVAWNQYKLAQRQHELAREQKALTEQQAQTAKENKDIAHNKLRMDQFDKRYMVYKSVLDFSLFSLGMKSKWLDFIKKNDVAIELPYNYRIIQNEENEKRHKNAIDDFLKIKESYIQYKKDTFPIINQSLFLYGNEYYEYFHSIYSKAANICDRKIDKIQYEWYSRILFNNTFHENLKPSIKELECELENHIIDIMPNRMKNILDISHI